ncbi:tachykinins-like isoform X2 [Pectinophora gossypiella]|uniref:tachykinins-like isoform X2 n=1 Tax=Pectinophora gossypiella TaxID=13191 RepID=UPI00214ECC3C|nr:tachykinins-like isoform X2 [Pectinophora gossypiella]
MASRTCIFVIICHLIYMISAQEVVKRVPQGFVGMRGKKYTDIDSAEVEHFFKRKPQFFVGVKGKKSFLNPLEQDALNYKRAPMGFVGMRGKKEYLTEDNMYYPDGYSYLPKPAGSLIGQIDYSTNDEIKHSDTPMLNELITEYLQKLENVNSGEFVSKLPRAVDETSDEHFTNEIDKRAANIHQFFGVRGKKSVHNKRPYDLTFRGKFIGVRGKKDAKYNGMQELKFLLDQSAPWPKRKTQMGFFGMRGKKWTDAASPEADVTN